MASTTMKELKVIAKNTLICFGILFTNSQSLNAFEASRTTQWHSSQGDVMHFLPTSEVKKKSTYRP
jgi:hypothetical protein